MSEDPTNHRRDQSLVTSYNVAGEIFQGSIIFYSLTAYIINAKVSLEPSTTL